MMFRAANIDPCGIQIQGWESFGRIHFSRGLPLLASWFRVIRHRVISPD
jgi:hypothetical protein